MYASYADATEELFPPCSNAIGGQPFARKVPRDRDSCWSCTNHRCGFLRLKTEKSQVFEISPNGRELGRDIRPLAG